MVDDKKYKKTIEEIKASQFKMKADVDHLSSEYWYSFPEKKARTALYFKKVTIFCL